LSSFLLNPKRFTSYICLSALGNESNSLGPRYKTLSLLSFCIWHRCLRAVTFILCVNKCIRLLQLLMSFQYIFCHVLVEGSGFFPLFRPGVALIGQPINWNRAPDDAKYNWCTFPERKYQNICCPLSILIFLRVSLFTPLSPFQVCLTKGFIGGQKCLSFRASKIFLTSSAVLLGATGVHLLPPARMGEPVNSVRLEPTSAIPGVNSGSFFIIFHILNGNSSTPVRGKRKRERVQTGLPNFIIMSFRH
jgi:hypothetical protein